MTAGRLRTHRPDALTFRISAGFLSRCLAWIAACRRRSKERHALSVLDERLLRVSRCDAQRETGKPFWK